MSSVLMKIEGSTKFAILVFFLLGTLISCKQDSRIEGHWHLKRNEFDSIHSTLDILSIDDTSAIENRFSFSRNEIKHFSEERYLVSGECGGFFTYEIGLTGNEIYLSNAQGYGDFYGKRCELTTAHILQDYKQSLLLDLDFPSVQERDFHTSCVSENLLVQSIIIGKGRGLSADSDSIVVQVNDKLVNNVELDRYIAKASQFYHLDGEDCLPFRLVVDKGLSMDDFRSFVRKLEVNGITKIFLACKKNALIVGENPIRDVNLADFDLEKDCRVIQDLFH